MVIFLYVLTRFCSFVFKVATIFNWLRHFLSQTVMDDSVSKIIFQFIKNEKGETRRMHRILLFGRKKKLHCWFGTA